MPCKIAYFMQYLFKVTVTILTKTRGGEVVSHEAHNLEATVQFRPPQQVLI